MHHACHSFLLPLSAEAFADIGMVMEASEAAALSKDSALLSRIKGMAGEGIGVASSAIGQIRGKFG